MPKFYGIDYNIYSDNIPLKSYADRVFELEQAGLTTSDAQAVADVEVIKGLTQGE